MASRLLHRISASGSGIFQGTMSIRYSKKWIGPDEKRVAMKIQKSKKILFPIVFVVLCVLAAIPAVYVYRTYIKPQVPKDPQQAQAEELQQVLSAVSKLVELPTNETPTVATVSDKEKLKNQAFFVRAENGDKVVIYTNEKKAILYRPSTNKIVEIAPVNISSPSAAANASPTPEAMVKIALRNGTNVVGLTRKYETALKDKIQNVEVTEKENANSRNYEKSVLIDLKGNATRATAFAELLGMTVAPMPDGEPATDADILIIIGSDLAKTLE